MFGWDGNPLRRRIDRLEGTMVATLIVVFLVAAPALTGMAGHWARNAGLRQQHAELAWRLVPATVDRGAAARQGDPQWPAETVWTMARWTAPDGRPRQGWIPVRPGTSPGSGTRVWVSRSGTPTGLPLRRAQADEWMAVCEVVTVPGLLFVFLLAGRAGQWMLRRRRLGGWDEAWQAVGPQWTRHG